MKYISIASPKPSAGVVASNGKKVVPDQAMSLAEILERFTRGESLEVGKAIHYDDDTDGIDLEKVQYLDMTEKAELAQQQAEIVKHGKAQAARKAAKAKQEEEDRIRKEIEEQVRKGGPPDPSKVTP